MDPSAASDIAFQGLKMQEARSSSVADGSKGAAQTRRTLEAQLNQLNQLRPTSSNQMPPFHQMPMSAMPMAGTNGAFFNRNAMLGSKLGIHGASGMGVQNKNNKEPHAQDKLEEVMRQNLGRLAIRRLARRGGCKRISAKIHKEARQVMGQYLVKVLKDVSVFAEHSRRTTVRTTDVVRALRRSGKGIYGYGN